MRVPNSVYGGVLSIGVASLAFLSLNTFSPAAASPAADEPTVGDLVVAVTHKPVSCFIKSKKGDTLKMHYDGTLANGTPFDSSRTRGQPFTFTLGQGQVIKGWDAGLMDMCPGEQRTLTIPPHMGYGSRGAGGVIPGGATLQFEVELLDITNRKAGKEELK